METGIANTCMGIMEKSGVVTRINGNRNRNDYMEMGRN